MCATLRCRKFEKSRTPKLKRSRRSYRRVVWVKICLESDHLLRMSWYYSFCWEFRLSADLRCSSSWPTGDGFLWSSLIRILMVHVTKEEVGEVWYLPKTARKDVAQLVRKTSDIRCVIREGWLVIPESYSKTYRSRPATMPLSDVWMTGAVQAIPSTQVQVSSRSKGWGRAVTKRTKTSMQALLQFLKKMVIWILMHCSYSGLLYNGQFWMAEKSFYDTAKNHRI